MRLTFKPAVVAAVAAVSAFGCGRDTCSNLNGTWRSSPEIPSDAATYCDGGCCGEAFIGGDTFRFFDGIYFDSSGLCQEVAGTCPVKIHCSWGQATGDETFSSQSDGGLAVNEAAVVTWPDGGFYCAITLAYSAT